MKFFRLFLHDIYYGILPYPKKWLAILVLYSFLFLSFTFDLFHLFYFDIGSIWNINSLLPTFGDVIMGTVGGTLPYIAGMDNNFSFPTVWLMCYLLVCYFTLNYLTEDLSQGGIQVIVRAKSRMYWWLSKCLWNVITVTLIYAISFGTLYLLSIATGKLNTLELNPEIFAKITMQPLPAAANNTQLFYALCIMPWAVGVAINLMQMTLTLFIKPIFAFFATAGYLVIGVYYAHPTMLANYAIPIRSEMVGIYNFQTSVGLLSCLGLCLICVIVGIIIIGRKDIVNSAQ